MSLFIVCVASCFLDGNREECGQIADAFVPVEADDEAEACRRAVVWHTDNGVAVEGGDLLWKAVDADRGVSFKATKCLGVSADEMNFFLSVTQGLSTATVIGRQALR